METAPSNTEAQAQPAAERLIAAIVARLRETAGLVCGRDRLEQGAVHEARKNLKKIRAGLRLLSDSADLKLKRENAFCRDVGRLLSGLRDTDVCLLTLEILRSRGIGSADELATRLRARREELHDADAPDGRAQQEIIADLAGVERTLVGLDPARFPNAALIDSVDRSRRLGRRRYGALVMAPDPEAFHELRKAAKRELYQRRFLADGAPVPDARIEVLEELAEHLGLHQDLAVLRRVAQELGDLGEELDSAITDLIAQERSESLAIADRVYGSGR